MKLWQDSQLTMNFLTPKFSVPQAQRFKIYSIYWPQRVEKRKMQGREVEDVHTEAMKVSKMIDEEDRLARGHKKEDRRFNYNHSPQKYHRSAEVSPAGSRMLPPKEEKIVERLFVKCPKGRSPPTRDKFGFLNWEVLPETELVQQPLFPQSTEPDLNCKLEQSLRTTTYSQRVDPSSRGFSRSRRIDLSRPENFYPGPGSYRIVRYLEGRRHR